ncbi:MAG: flagellar hook-basal body complex protein FliE [bacterium]|nr:flagellar hook-basal body complex protein FliE [bacterium]
MNIEAINPILMRPQTSSMEFVEQSQPSFSHWLSEQVSNTNDQLNAADKALNQLASGHGEHLHQTMIRFEEAKLSFQYLEQIRNRLMNAYQDLLREQI